MVIGMLSTKYIHETFRNFIKQCSSEKGLELVLGEVPVNYGIKLNFKINGKKKVVNDEYPLLNISDYNEFLSHLSILFNKLYDKCIEDKEYYQMNKQAYSEYVMMNIFVNMNSMDFSAPISYFDRISRSLDQNYKINNRTHIGDMILKGEKVKIYKDVKKNRLGMETLQHIVFTFENSNGEKYVFPRIHYYLEDNHAYILGVQKGKEELDNSFAKKVDRYLRKMDKGIEENYNDEGSIESIKDISVSALGALTLFSAYYPEIENIYMIDYLPLRYMNKVNNKNDEQIAKINNIQRNITDKFMMTGVRLATHFQHLDCGIEYDILNIEVNKYNHQEGNIIYELYESVNKNNLNRKNNDKAK